MFSETSPDIRDELIKVVISGRSGPMTCLTIRVGTVSSEHPLDGDFMTMRYNSTSLIEENPAIM